MAANKAAKAAKVTAADCVAKEAEAKGREEKLAKSEAELKAAEDKVREAKDKVDAQQAKFDKKCAKLKATAEDPNLGSVQTGKAANELAQLQSKDPLPLE